MKKPTAAAKTAHLVNSGRVGQAQRLSDPEFAPQLAEMRQRLRDDPAYGKRLLRGAGILNTRGKLSKSFGG